MVGGGRGLAWGGLQGSTIWLISHVKIVITGCTYNSFISILDQSKDQGVLSYNIRLGNTSPWCWASETFNISFGRWKDKVVLACLEPICAHWHWLWTPKLVMCIKNAIEQGLARWNKNFLWKDFQTCTYYSVELTSYFLWQSDCCCRWQFSETLGSNALRSSLKVTYGSISSPVLCAPMVWFAQLPSGAAECITAAQFAYFLQFCKVALPPVSYPGHMRAQGSGNYSTCALLIQLGKVGHMCQSQFANQVQLAFKWRLSSPMFPAAPRWRLWHFEFWVVQQGFVPLIDWFEFKVLMKPCFLTAQYRLVIL